jgi:hypothetical protein
MSRLATTLPTLHSPAGVFGHTRNVRLVGRITDYLFIVANTPLIEIRNGRVAKAASLRAIGLNPLSVALHRLLNSFRVCMFGI